MLRVDETFEEYLLAMHRWR